MVQACLQHIPISDDTLLQGVHHPLCCRRSLAATAAAICTICLRPVVIAHNSLRGGHLGQDEPENRTKKGGQHFNHRRCRSGLRSTK